MSIPEICHIFFISGFLEQENECRYIDCLTCLSPGTSLTIVPSALTQVICGMGVPLDWQMTSVPVVLLKSTWLGGSWMNTGPEVMSPCIWASLRPNAARATAKAHHPREAAAILCRLIVEAIFNWDSCAHLRHEMKMTALSGDANYAQLLLISTHNQGQRQLVMTVSWYHHNKEERDLTVSLYLCGSRINVHVEVEAC